MKLIIILMLIGLLALAGCNIFEQKTGWECLDCEDACGHDTYYIKYKSYLGNCTNECLREYETWNSSIYEYCNMEYCEEKALSLPEVKQYFECIEINCKEDCR